MQHFEQEFELQGNEVMAGGEGIGFGISPNCVRIDGTATILHGNATVRWDAMPGAPEMELALGTDGDLVTFARGTRQAFIEFADLELKHGGSDTFVAWQVPRGEAAASTVGVEGALTLSLDFVGWLNFEGDWACSVDH